MQHPHNVTLSSSLEPGIVARMYFNTVCDSFKLILQYRSCFQWLL